MGERWGLISVWRKGRIVRLQGSTWDETEARDAKLDEGIVAEVEAEAGTEETEVEVETGTQDENDLEARTDLLGEIGRSVLTRGMTGAGNSRSLKYWNRSEILTEWAEKRKTKLKELNYDTMFLKI